MTDQSTAIDYHFTLKIIVGMLLGIVVGLLVRWLPLGQAFQLFLIRDIFQIGGQIFINIIKLLVVPIVLVSLICGTGSLGDLRKLGRIGGKTLLFYLLTTALAITLAMLVAYFFQVGKGINLTASTTFSAQQAPSLKAILINLIPANPFKAIANGSMLQIIVFALLFGMALSHAGDAGVKVYDFFVAVNAVLMKLIVMIMKTAPYGVFFLLAGLFARVGFTIIYHLLGYFFVVLFVLAMQLFAVYTVLLRLIGRLNPWTFLRKMYSAMLFAFSISSSNASIPIVLRNVEKRLGVANSVAAFVIPLGSTINMDGTAIMQGVATLFIAHAYHIAIGFTGYLTVILMATLASIGTAGVPSVGLITLAMVLEQVGLPVQGIALIIGVDRLLDMARTAVNVAGDATIACLVAKSENALDEAVFQGD